MMENNLDKERLHSTIIDQTKLLINLFLRLNLSDVELSKRTGIPTSTVGRRFRNKDRIKEAFPDNGEEIFELVTKKRQENLQLGRTIGSQLSKVNNMNEEAKPRFRLDIFNKDKESQWKILGHIALTFRLKLYTLSELFKIDENEIWKNLDYAFMDSNIRWSLEYLFQVEPYEEDSVDRFTIFYRDYLTALSDKDIEMQRFLLRQLFDYDVIKLKEKRENNKFDSLTDDDIMVIINYQLKYALSNYDTCILFHCSREKYKKEKDRILEDKPKLKERMECVNEYNILKHKLAVREELKWQ